jgi:hypothetical protein
MSDKWINRRRFVTTASAISLGSVAGCTSDTSEADNEQSSSTDPLPFSETDSSDFPSYSGTVSISGEDDYWSFKLPMESSFELQYTATNMKSESYDFDILVVSREQYDNYIQEIKETGPLIQDIDRLASKEVTSEAKKSGELDAGTYFFVADNTDISDAGDVGSENTREININLETHNPNDQPTNIEITVEDSSKTIGSNEQINQKFTVENTGDSVSNRTITANVNGESIKEYQAQIEPSKSKEYEITLGPSSEDELLTEGENTIVFKSEGNRASVTYTIDQPDTIRHDVGERFTVGDGDQAVEYVVEEVYADEVIGGEYVNTKSDGIFLVVELSITNRGNETFSIGSDLFRAVNGQGDTYDVVSGNSFIAADDSIDGEPILFEEIQPDVETSGALAFDVPYGAAIAMIIEPAGFWSTGSDHLIDFGNMPTRDET